MKAKKYKKKYNFKYVSRYIQNWRYKGRQCCLPTFSSSLKFILNGQKNGKWVSTQDPGGRLDVGPWPRYVNIPRNESKYSCWTKRGWSSAQNTFGKEMKYVFMVYTKAACTNGKGIWGNSRSLLRCFYARPRTYHQNRMWQWCTIDAHCGACRSAVNSRRRSQLQEVECSDRRI